MKKINIHIIYIFILLSFAFSFAVKPIAIVLKAKGDAKVTVKKSGKTVKLKRGFRLESGDKIVTAKKSFAAIKFIDDGSLVRIRSKSSCTISGKKEKNSLAKNIYVEFGTIFSKITRQKSRFRVSTPTSVASVKGTAFWTRQEFKGGTWYFGEEGVVEISNKVGSALLRAGETGHVPSAQGKPVIRKTKPGEKPGDEGEASLEELEFNFENEQGTQKTLKMKIKKK